MHNHTPILTANIIKKGWLFLFKNHASLALEYTNTKDTAFMIKKSDNTIVPIIHLLLGN